MPDPDSPSDATPTEQIPRIIPGPAAPHHGPRRPPGRLPPPVHLSGGDPEPAATIINRVLDEQERLNLQFAAGHVVRDDRPPRRPTVREVAAQRAERQDREVLRQLRHQGHLDTVETAKSYVGLACLLVLLVTLVIVGVYAYGIGAGWYRWGPVPVGH